MKTRHFTLALAVSTLLLSSVVDAQVSKRSKKRAASSQSKTSKTTQKSTGSERKASSSASAKSSAKRAAATTSNSKRAAAGNTKRAAATTRNSARAAATKRVVASSGSSTRENVNTSNTEEVKKTTSTNPCPIDTLIRKAYSDNGDELYYKTKTTTCDIPENTEEVAWDMSNSEKLKQYTLKKGWIEESEAISFSCEDGFLNVNRSCKSFDEFCPLNETVEKKGNGYINPYTGDSCIAYTGANVTRLTDSENNSDIPTGKAYRLTCPSGYYTNTDNYIQCSLCPSDKPYSIKGTNIGISSCSIATDSSGCPDGKWMGNGEKECKEYNSYTFVNIENIPDNGSLGVGLYNFVLEAKDKPAEKKTLPVTKDTKFAKVQDETGSYFAVDGKIILNSPAFGIFKIEKANGSEGLK